MAQFTRYVPADAADLVALWNVGAGHAAPLDARAWAWLTSEDPGFDPAGLLVARSKRGKALGFVLAKAVPPTPGLARYAGQGWVAALAVAPETQGQGLGRALLGAGEAWLRSRGAHTAVLGGAFHHHVPGVPTALPEAVAFFARAGYQPEPDAWDVFRNLQASPALAQPVVAPGLALRPCTTPEVPALLALLAQEFPGRWPHDVAEALARGASRPKDLMLAVGPDGPLGFAHLHPPEAPGTWRWGAAVPGVAALGPIGIATEARGLGLGRALLLAGLSHLAGRGAGPCVIDWTDLLDFYALAGFSPWRCYHRARRRLT
ncbi:MAG: GNAT family N-acetyltransferase [Candidatus Sericytochromatia bacterium]|nr:GNAT family N-acetyltransferase [Candidatus Sericytochromatia bacterium]